jgi:ABC-type nitrate/sulfonate/bicarbonate transport system permease component
MVALAAVIALGEAAGRLDLLPPDVPSPTDVVTVVARDPTRSLLWESTISTLREAAVGYAIGNAIAISVSFAVALAPAAVAIVRVAVVIESIPLIAVVPLISTSGARDATPVITAALAVVFGTLVLTTSALASVSSSLSDVLAVLGARRTTKLLHLQLPAAIPRILDGLKIAAPAAVVGAVLGEWFGSSVGLGPLIVSSMQNYDVAQLWAAALAAAVPASSAYAVLDYLQRRAALRFAA